MNMFQNLQHFKFDLREGQPKALLFLLLILVFGLWAIWMAFSFAWLII